MQLYYFKSCSLISRKEDTFYLTHVDLKDMILSIDYSNSATGCCWKLPQVLEPKKFGTWECYADLATMSLNPGLDFTLFLPQDKRTCQSCNPQFLMEIHKFSSLNFMNILKINGPLDLLIRELAASALGNLPVRTAGRKTLLPRIFKL